MKTFDGGSEDLNTLRAGTRVGLVRVSGLPEASPLSLQWSCQPWQAPPSPVVPTNPDIGQPCATVLGLLDVSWGVDGAQHFAQVDFGRGGGLCVVGTFAEMSLVLTADVPAVNAFGFFPRVRALASIGRGGIPRPTPLYRTQRLGTIGFGASVASFVPHRAVRLYHGFGDPGVASGSIDIPRRITFDSWSGASLSYELPNANNTHTWQLASGVPVPMDALGVTVFNESGVTDMVETWLMWELSL